MPRHNNNRHATEKRESRMAHITQGRTRKFEAGLKRQVIDLDVKRLERELRVA